MRQRKEKLYAILLYVISIFKAEEKHGKTKEVGCKKKKKRDEMGNKKMRDQRRKSRLAVIKQEIRWGKGKEREKMREIIKEDSYKSGVY